MSSTPFTPYWKAVGPPADPYSWVFFVVAQIAGRHRPVAIVSSLGDNFQDETLQGCPLLAACHRTVTIFADQANHPTIRAELALAAGYYMRDGDREYRPEPVELPELNRVMAQPTLRGMRPWYRGMQEFPFIMACLLQGVGFDTQKGVSRAAQPEPLSTVYRDTSIEWGMVVVDITKLDAVRYGIVGFGVGPMKFVTSPRNEGYTMGAMGPGAFERGELRVMDKVRPRRAMSAAEYMAKFKDNHETLPTYDSNTSKQLLLLARIPLIDAAAMGLVWPQEDDILPSLANLSVGTTRSLPDRVITSLIQSTFDIDDFDMSIFDEVRAIPNFQDLLWRNLVQHSARLGSTRSAGQLIRLAFANQEHLGLEQLNNLSAEAISAALRMPEIGKVTSISFCIDSIRSTPAGLIDVLSEADTLREIYFLQSPTRESDALSAQIFEELAARPQILWRTKVVLAGAYSAALRKRFWLPTIPKSITSNIADAVQVAPLDVFPVQQMLVRHQITTYGNIKFGHKYVHLGDALLKPERFATGFLLYLHSLLPSMDAIINPKAQLFSFSSAPASFAVDALTTAEVSPILAENFAMAAQCWPRVRNLVPGGWTIIVSLEIHRDHEAARFNNNSTLAYQSHFIRYAFVRACQQRIVVDLTPLTPPGPEELNVVGLKEFLDATAPEVDPAVVDHRLHDVAEALNSSWNQGTLPPGIEPVSVLSQTEAADMLLEFLEDARKVKRRLRVAMEENPEGEFPLNDLQRQKFS